MKRTCFLSGVIFLLCGCSASPRPGDVFSSWVLVLGTDIPPELTSERVTKNSFPPNDSNTITVKGKAWACSELQDKLLCRESPASSRGAPEYLLVSNRRVEDILNEDAAKTFAEQKLKAIAEEKARADAEKARQEELKKASVAALVRDYEPYREYLEKHNLWNLAGACGQRVFGEAQRAGGNPKVTIEMATLFCVCAVAEIESSSIPRSYKLQIRANLTPNKQEYTALDPEVAKVFDEKSYKCQGLWQKHGF